MAEACSVFYALSTVRNVCTCTEWVGQVCKHTQYELGTGAKSVVNVGCMYIRTYVYSMEELVVWGLGVLWGWVRVWCGAVLCALWGELSIIHTYIRTYVCMYSVWSCLSSSVWVFTTRQKEMDDWVSSVALMCTRMLQWTVMLLCDCLNVGRCHNLAEHECGLPQACHLIVAVWINEACVHWSEALSSVLDCRPTTDLYHFYVAPRYRDMMLLTQLLDEPHQ